MSDYTSERYAELELEAKSLGWTLTLVETWRYLLTQNGKLPNPCTCSAVRLDPADPGNPLSGLDSVSHMLSQIARLQAQV